MRFTPLDILILVAALVLLPVQSARAAKLLREKPRDEIDLVRRYWLIVLRGIVISAAILIDWQAARRPWSGLGLAPPTNRSAQMGFALNVVMAAYYAYALLIQRMSPAKVAQVRQHMDSLRIIPDSRREFIVFQLLALTASPTEELVYRGFLLGILSPLITIWGAVALSSVIFGLGHVYQGVKGVLRTGLIGLAFAVAYVATQSLWWLMIAHTMANLFGGLYALRLKRLAEGVAT